MGKPISEYKNGGAVGKYIGAGHYKLRFIDVKMVLGGSGAPYVVMGLQVINPGNEQGNRTELGFSCGETSEGFAKPWYLALGFKETDCPPVEDIDSMETFMKRKIGAVVECTLTCEKNEQGYRQNQVDPPWDILAAETEEGDLKFQQDDQPPF
jgi:hypothetical protein